MDFSGRNVVVTGGTGALGGAVVGALVEAGAICRVSYHHEAEAERFAFRAHESVKLVAADLTDEAAVATLYAGTSPLWASIHIAGGFAAAKIVDTDKAALMSQLDTNLVSSFLCWRAAIKAMTGKGGRIVHIAARDSSAGRRRSGK